MAAWYNPRMKFSFNIQNFAPFDDVHRTVQLAREAEAAGWDGFFLWDHIHWNGPPMLDPWVTLALTLRQPAVAQQLQANPQVGRSPGCKS